MKNKLEHLPDCVAVRTVIAWIRYCRTRGLREDQPIWPQWGQSLPDGRFQIELENRDGWLATYVWTGRRIVRINP